MTIAEIEENYYKYYQAIEFERIGLFVTIKDLFDPDTVLYLGSSIHITPSFIFQNVTYIDKDPFTERFFSDTKSLTEFICRKKVYKQQPYLEFIKCDFVQKNMVLKNKYDLVLSIYSTNKIDTAIKYVKNNGIIVFLPLSIDSPLFSENNALESIGFIESKKNKYYLVHNSNSGKVRYNRMMVDNKFSENNSYKIFKKRLE